MKRKHRHELKQNEILIWIEETTKWLSGNQRLMMTMGGVLLAAALLLGGIYYFTAYRERQAQGLLNESLELYHGRIQESSVVQSTSGTEFANHEERYQKSLEAFEKVIDQYSGTDQGRQARYYAALCHQGLTRYEEAEKLLEEVAGGSRDLLHYMASQVLAVVKSERGDYDGAAEIYRLMVEDTNNPLPKDHLIFNLAQVKEEAGNLEEAQKNYERVLEEYPDSVLRPEVLQRNELIKYRLET